MFSKVRVAGALLRESHSWYRTHVLSRSSMKPFSWDLGGRGVREAGPRVGGGRAGRGLEWAGRRWGGLGVARNRALR